MAAARHFFLSAFVLILAAAALPAQETSATILGTVMNEEGIPLPGVAVTALSPELIGVATATSDERGAYQLLGLAPGAYDLTFELPGFAKSMRQLIALAPGQTAAIKTVLPSPWRVPDIAVRLPDPLDVKSAAAATSLDRETLRELPGGRTAVSRADLAPGFTNESLLLGGTSVDGASGLENKFYIDGVDVTDIRDGMPGQAVAIDFIDGARFQSSGAPASSPGALGGVISVQTRSGGNELHGEVVGYYSGAALRSAHPDILALSPDDHDQAVYLPYRSVYGDNDDQRIEAGFSLGGSIFKDKLWFFGSFMPVFYANARELDYGGYSRRWKRSENELNFLLTLDSRPLKNLRLGASLLNLFRRTKGDPPALPSVQDPTISYNDYGFSYPNLSASMRADMTVGDHALVSARAGYFRSNQNHPLVGSGSTPYYYFRTEAPGGYINTTPTVFPEIPPQYLLPPYGGYTESTRPIIHSMKRNVAEKLSLGTDASLFFRLAGEHQLRTGISWTRRGQDVDNTPDAPIIFLAWNRSLGDYDYGRGKYGYYAVRNSELTGPYGDFYKAYANMLALYVQDSWTLANRLTLTAGLRAEIETIPSYATGNPKYEVWRPIHFNLGDMLAPRLGVVWDIRGDSSLRAITSFGVFHDEMKLAMAAKAYGGFKWQSAYYTLDTYEWDRIGVNGYYPGKLLLPGKTLNFREPDMDATDPGLKPMTQNEFSLGLEKMLGRDIVLSVRFVRRHLVRAVEDIGVSTAIGQYSYIANPGSPFIREKFAWARANGLLPQAIPDPEAAKRDYDGLTVSLEKRFSASWLGGCSYTFSRLRGNYAGLACDRDLESLPPYLTGCFDAWYSSRTLTMADASGPLPGDRPHRFKAYGSYAFPFGLSAGMVLQAMSGAPNSTVWTIGTDKQAFLPYGRGDLPRSPALVLASLFLEYGMNLGRGRLSASLNVDNALNASTAGRLFPVFNQGTATTPSAAEMLTGTWNIRDYGARLDPRYLMESDFLEPLTARIGLKFSF